MDTELMTSTYGIAASGRNVSFASVDIGPSTSLTARDRALLRAVEAGRCDLVDGAAPEIRVDGRWYCDQARAHDLVTAGLLTALMTTGRGRGPAALTLAGRRALGR